MSFKNLLFFSIYLCKLETGGSGSSLSVVELGLRWLLLDPALACLLCLGNISDLVVLLVVIKLIQKVKCKTLLEIYKILKHFRFRELLLKFYLCVLKTSRHQTK